MLLNSMLFFLLITILLFLNNRVVNSSDSFDPEKIIDQLQHNRFIEDIKNSEIIKDIKDSGIVEEIKNTEIVDKLKENDFIKQLIDSNIIEKLNQTRTLDINVLKELLANNTTNLPLFLTEMIEHPTQPKEEQVVNELVAPGLLNNINYYGQYAGIAKCNDDLLFNWQCRYCQSLGSGNRVHKVLSNSDLQTKGVIVVHEGRKEIIISFRGTETEINLIQDINIVLNDFLDFDSNLFKVRNLKVHNGFLTMTNSLFESMIQILQELLRQDQGYTLIFTGHSLGGAIAGLSAVKAYYKLNLPKERIKVFTFGQPRLGNKEYASYVNQLGLTYYRMVNYNDPVPHAPPRLFGYFHHSLELFQSNIVNDRFEIKVCNNINTIFAMEDPSCSLATIPDLDRKLHSRFDKLDFAPKC